MRDMEKKEMFLDVLSYQAQIRELERKNKGKKELDTGAEYLSGIKKGERLKPVCTIVLYYGEDEWDGPKSLHDLIEWEGVPEHMKAWFADYPMILVDVFRFPDWERFQTDLREVFGFIRNSHDKQALDEFLKFNRERLSMMAEDACDLIEEVTRTEIIREFRSQVREEKQDMCKAIDDMLKDNWDEGYSEAQKQVEEQRIKMEKRIQELEKEVRNLRGRLSA